MNDPRFRFLWILAALMTLLLLWVIKAFALALVWAAVLASLAYPVHQRLASALGGREGAASAVTVVLTLAIVVVPAMLFLGVLLDDAVEMSAQLQPWVDQMASNPDGLQQALGESETFRELLPYQDRVVEKAGELAGTAAGFVAQAVVDAASGAANSVLMLFVTMTAMAFFLRSGGELIDELSEYTPLNGDDEQRLISTFTTVSRATLKGTLVIGVVQGGLAGAALAMAGISGAVLWSAIMMVLSVLPGIGTALVWVPAVIYLALNGQTVAAVAVALWCALVVGTIDNVLRPLLVGKDTEMPDILVLVTTLGGVMLFGVAGVVLGPVIGALFATAWEMLRHARNDAPADAGALS